MRRALLPGPSLGPTLALLVLCALGCGLPADAPPPPLPTEPLPLVVPPGLVGTWVETARVGDRDLLAWPCEGSPLTLRLPQGGPLSLSGGSGAAVEAALTAAELRSDGSLSLNTDRGSLRLLDRDEGMIWAQGSLPGFSEGRLLANPDADAVEQLFPAASTCGRSLDLSALSWLSTGRYNSAGDPCVAAGLSVDLTARRPTLVRSMLALQLQAARDTDRGTWVTVADGEGGQYGIRLVQAQDGAVQVWQRLDSGMAFETLRPARGLCAGQGRPAPR